MITAVDLNTDLAEGYGPYVYGHDEAMLDYVSSANVACGFHAGDPRRMGEAVALALEKGIGIGAHPSFPDRVGFGRRDMVMTPDEVSTDLLYQLGALDAFCRTAGTELRHVKPHGALYNRLAVDATLAKAVAQTLALYRRDLVLIGLPNSAIERAAQAAGVPFAREGYVDRAYNPDGSLVSRRVPGAVITDPAQVARRAVRLALRGKVATITGDEIALPIDTICLQSDSEAGLDLAQTVRDALGASGVAVLPVAEVVAVKVGSARKRESAALDAVVQNHTARR